MPCCFDQMPGTAVPAGPQKPGWLRGIGLVTFDGLIAIQATEFSESLGMKDVSFQRDTVIPQFRAVHG